ncbi:MAG: hypothetical protein M3540_12875 [Actinomycetota bacterium]|nr:hypothetical protein [Actinomycetota bacterium]
MLRAHLVVLGLVAAGIVLGGVFAGSVSARTSEMPTPRQGPSISGTPQEGQTLTASEGQWLYVDGRGCGSECVYTYQWQRCNPGGFGCVNINGATNKTYVLTAADAGNRLVVVNTLTKYDCDAQNQNCKYVSSSQNSALTPIISARAVAKPTSTGPPAISGIASEREVLTTTDGGWAGPAPITTARQWLRCDAAGNGCGNIPGATAPTYTVTAHDVGLTIRVFASATNSGGTSSALSAPTPVVTPLAPRPGRTTLSIVDVSLPHRLLIDRVSVAVRPIRSLTPFVVRFRVSDTRGFRIVGALVQVASVPPDVTRAAAEVTTGRDGWASVTLRPTAKLQLRRGGSLYLLVRARKSGENVLAGVSTRRLVRLPVAAPRVPVPATAKASQAGK